MFRQDVIRIEKMWKGGWLGSGTLWKCTGWTNEQTHTSKIFYLYTNTFKISFSIYKPPTTPTNSINSFPKKFFYIFVKKVKILGNFYFFICLTTIYEQDILMYKEIRAYLSIRRVWYTVMSSTDRVNRIVTVSDTSIESLVAQDGFQVYL